MEFLIGLVVVIIIAVGFKLYQDTKEVPEVPVKPAPKPKSDVPSVAQLKKLTKQQLFDLAEKKNIKVKKSGTKAEVIKQISSAK
ncbi:MAG: hypothetical protein EBY39_12845 [Flavobacteriia bacterium]|jgi:hypothetical protein|nr:hypothetical protein [Flavobacteriia bacterium]